MAINWFVALQICTYNKIVTCPIQYLINLNNKTKQFFFIRLNLTLDTYWYISLEERITAKIF